MTRLRTEKRSDILRSMRNSDLVVYRMDDGTYMTIKNREDLGNDRLTWQEFENTSIRIG